MRALALQLSLALAGSVVSPVRGAPLELLPDASRPPVLDAFELPEGLEALAFAQDGTVAAVASTHGRAKQAQATVRLISTARPAREIDVPGHVRDLLFAPDESELFVIQERPARKNRSGERFLLRVDLARLKPRRALYLPSTAQALAYWPQRHALLVAARNEVRTLLLPDLRSGPLFRIPGDNLALAAIGGSRILLGQSDRLAVVDLADAPGHDEMPLRETATAPAAVADLGLEPGGAGGLVRLADDRVFHVTTSPLALVAALGPAAPASPAAAAEPPVEPARAAPAAPSSPPPPAEPATPSPPPPAEPALPAAPPAAPPPRLPTAMHGTVSGPARIAVVAVVVFGPDNLLHEAARVTPLADGTWLIESLPPGRYRVVVDGGGERVLVTEPRFHMVDIGRGGAVPAIDFAILRSL